MIYCVHQISDGSYNWTQAYHLPAELAQGLDCLLHVHHQTSCHHPVENGSSDITHLRNNSVSAECMLATMLVYSQMPGCLARDLAE